MFRINAKKAIATAPNTTLTFGGVVARLDRLRKATRAVAASGRPGDHEHIEQHDERQLPRRPASHDRVADVFLGDVAEPDRQPPTNVSRRLENARWRRHRMTR